MGNNSTNINEIISSQDVGDKIVINDKYKNLYYPLSEQVLNDLKNLIMLDKGCTSPLTIDEKYQLLDGHHRLQICQDNNLPYSVIQRTFNSEEEKIAWIILNQSSRRNLNNLSISYYRGVLYNLSKLECNKKGNQYTKVLSEVVSESKIDTAKRIGGKNNVTDRTVRSDGKFAERLDFIAEEINKIKSGLGQKFRNDYLLSKDKWAKKETLVALIPSNFIRFSDNILNKFRESADSNVDVCDKDYHISARVFASVPSVLAEIKNKDKEHNVSEDALTPIIYNIYRQKTEDEIKLIKERFAEIDLSNLLEFIVKQTYNLANNTFEFSNDSVKITFKII